MKLFNINPRILTIIVFTLFLVMRLPGIMTDMSNSDAFRWHHRSESFYQGLKQGNLKETYQRYHPGVTLMWLSSGTEAAIRLYNKIIDTPFKSSGNVEGYILIDGISKIVLIFALFVLLIIQYKSIVFLFGRQIALIYVILASFEPYLIGINRWYHLTSLEAFLAFCGFLAVLTWVKTRNRRDLVFAGILMGLGVLTKFSAVVVVAMAVGVIFYTKRNAKFWKDWIFLLIPCFLTVLLLFPALWVDPVYVVQKILNAGAEAVGGSYSTVLFAETYPFIFYPVVLLFKLSPISLGLFTLSLYFVVKSRVSGLIYLSGYLLVYLLAFSFSEQKIERYLITLFPPLLLITSYGVSQLKSFIKYPVLISSVLFGICMFLKFYPVPSLYYSPIFGGISYANKIGLLDQNGDFYAQAAFHLNEKGRDVKVFLPSNTQSFTPYFKGNFTGVYSDEVDFVVLSLDSSATVSDYPKCNEIEKSYSVDSVDLVTIYSCAE